MLGDLEFGPFQLVGVDHRRQQSRPSFGTNRLQVLLVAITNEAMPTLPTRPPWPWRRSDRLAGFGPARV